MRRDRFSERQRVEAAPVARPAAREPLFPVAGTYSRPALEAREKFIESEEKTVSDAPEAEYNSDSVEAETFHQPSETSVEETESAAQHTHDRESDDRFDEAHERGGRAYDEPTPQSHDEAAGEPYAHEMTDSELKASDFYEPEPEPTDSSSSNSEPSLVSTDAAASISAHFQALAASTIINDSGILREYAKDMLRPMLKQWLDDNLPVMVEKLVRAEIERVARGRR
jgi:cell pole-organizing protein PopZ